jgi:flavoprotein
MLAEEIFDWLRDALLEGNSFGSCGVGDCEVNGAVLQVFDGFVRVALVPSDLKGGGSLGDTVLDERVC